MPLSRVATVLLAVTVCCAQPVSSFVQRLSSAPSTSSRKEPLTTRMAVAAHLTEPAGRDAHYGRPLNVAQYLIDLHDAKATFDFCGGMMFQLVLTKKLKDHLMKIADGEGEQPVVFDASKSRMFQIPDYSQTGNADNVQLFHGREIRKVPDAAGGMGMVLQLSLAEEKDPEGWTPNEVEGYDGWGHDSGRIWRKGDMLEKEGFTTFKKDFGASAFALHHRFYLHFDRSNRLWLSAEDGCEGTPARSVFAPLTDLFELGR